MPSTIPAGPMERPAEWHAAMSRVEGHNIRGITSSSPEGFLRNALASLLTLLGLGSLGGEMELPALLSAPSEAACF